MVCVTGGRAELGESRRVNFTITPSTYQNVSSDPSKPVWAFVVAPGVEVTITASWSGTLGPYAVPKTVSLCVGGAATAPDTLVLSTFAMPAQSISGRWTPQARAVGQWTAATIFVLTTDGEVTLNSDAISAWIPNPAATYTLTTSKDGDGSGSITPEGVTQVSAEPGKNNVTLRAVADPGTTFVAWTVTPENGQPQRYDQTTDSTKTITVGKNTIAVATLRKTRPRVSFTVHDPAMTYSGQPLGGRFEPSVPVNYTVAYSGNGYAGGPITCTGRATAPGPILAGSYTYSIALLTPGYDVEGPTSGTFEIRPAPLTVTANPGSRVFKAADPAFTVEYSGLVSGETESVVSGAPGFITTATPTSNVGTGYTVTPTLGTLAAANYEFRTFNAAAFTITPKPVTFTFGNLVNKATGASFSATATPSDSDATFTRSLSYGPAVGTYTVSAEATGNYTGRGSEQAQVTAGDANVDASITATPTVTSEPGVVTVTWSSANASSVAVTGGPLNSTLRNGSETVTGLAAGTHTFAIVAQGSGGPVTRSVTVSVTTPGASVQGSLFIDGQTRRVIRTLHAQASATLTWNTQNATSVRLDGPLPTEFMSKPGGSYLMTGLSGVTIVTLTAQGNNGPVVRRASVEVVPPDSGGRVLTLSASPNPAPAVGGTVRLLGTNNANGGYGYVLVCEKTDAGEEPIGVARGSGYFAGYTAPPYVPVPTPNEVGTFELPPNTKTTRREFVAYAVIRDSTGGSASATFSQDPALPTAPQTVTLTPNSARVPAGATVNLAASGGHVGYVWGNATTSSAATATFTVPTTAVPGTLHTVTVHSPAGVAGGTNWLQSNTATATIEVVPAAQLSVLTPLASSLTVDDPSSPMHGRTYARIWDENGWKAFLGRAGVRFAAQGQGWPAVQAVELQGRAPGGAWTRLQLNTLSTRATEADVVFSVMLGETVAGQPLVPLSYEQGAPQTGEWRFRARLQNSNGDWSAYSAEVPVDVVLPIASKSVSGQTVPPAGALGDWFTASPVQTFTVQLWIP